jgi:hypothetical protein
MSLLCIIPLRVMESASPFVWEHEERRNRSMFKVRLFCTVIFYCFSPPSPTFLPISVLWTSCLFVFVPPSPALLSGAFSACPPCLYLLVTSLDLTHSRFSHSPSLPWLSLAIVTSPYQALHPSSLSYPITPGGGQRVELQLHLSRPTIPARGRNPLDIHSTNLYLL